MQAPACSMRHAPMLPARPVQLRLLRPSGACTPRVQPFRHSAIPRVRRQRCVVLSAQDRSGSNMAAAGDPHARTLQSLFQSFLRGLTLLPLLAAALLAPSAARASFLQGTKALPETFATAYDDRPHQAKDHQYPAWQRMQWADWREMQLTAEAKRRFAAGLLACGIMIVLALKLIAANASGAALDKADKSEGGKGKAGWKDTLGQADGGAAGRRRQQADALAAKSPSQGRTAAAAGAAGATLLQSGVDKGSVAAQPGRPRLEDVRSWAGSSRNNTTARGMVAAPRRPGGQPQRVTRLQPASPPAPARGSPSSAPTVVPRTAPGKPDAGKPDKEQAGSGSAAGGGGGPPLMSQDKLYDPLYHGDGGAASGTRRKPDPLTVEPTRLSEEDIYDPLFHGDAASASAAGTAGTESTGLSPEDIYDPLFHGDGGIVSGTRPTPDPLKVEPTRLAEEDVYDPLFHGDAASSSAAQTAGTESDGLSPDDIYDPLFHGDAALSNGNGDAFPRAGNGHASDIDALAAEIARGATIDSDDEGFPDSLDQLAAEVASGRRSMDELPSMGTQRVSTSAAYRRALAAQSTAVSPLTLTLGFLKVAFDAVTNPSAAIAASRLNNPGHVLITQRMGQSLTVSMRAPGGAADGSTAAERAERAVLATRRPLSGLLKAQVARPESERRWAAFAKYDLFHEALKDASAANPDAKYNPVRTVLAAVPPSGASKYDMVQSLLRGVVIPKPEDSKYDVVWHLLRAGRAGGATAAPKYDPVYDLLHKAAYAADWGPPSEALSDWDLGKYDPVAALFGAAVPTVRSKYDPLQAAFAAEAPVGDSKYDMVGQILAAAQAAPEHAPRDDPLRSLLDGLRRVVGLDAAPAGSEKYDPMPGLLRVRPAAPERRSKYDLWSWVRSHTIGSMGTQVIRAGGLAGTAPGKYDPAAPLLGALAGPQPDSPDDPLRLAIRRAAQQARGESPDMAVERAFVFRGPRGTVAVPVTAAESAKTGGRFPWSRGFWNRGTGGGAAESPFNAQLAASSAAQSVASPPAAPHGVAAGGAPLDSGAVSGAAEADSTYDPVPDLIKLWVALKASSARLDPLDAVNVIANRGAGDRFFHVASAYRRLAEDGDVRAKHRALFALAESTRVRLSLPAPEPEAVRSLQTLLREAGAQYAPVTSMLKGRDGVEQVHTLCVLHDLLVAPSPQRAQPPAAPPAADPQLAFFSSS